MWGVTYWSLGSCPPRLALVLCKPPSPLGKAQRHGPGPQGQEDASPGDHTGTPMPPGLPSTLPFIDSVNYAVGVEAPCRGS